MGDAVLGKIIQAIAEAEGREADDLAVVLQDHVDTDAIRLLAAHPSDSWTLQFELPDHTVRVTGDDEIFVDETRQRARS
ncbi:HalOD1 output domain-containing protein [Natronomonas marina]|jgi:hypothetical protein|uniref:HalOD1 output domain-containing protein n=1 Tax=Natronomonas marina TaxID=2961939 RepID=UPI0020C95BA9|nr:HalOD1 output domain-containing protein [Natronomonas marina]